MGPNKSPEELLAMPAGTPPPEVQSNLVDPPNFRPLGAVVLLFFWIAASIMLLLRTCMKIFNIRMVNLLDCEWTDLAMERETDKQ